MRLFVSAVLFAGLVAGCTMEKGPTGDDGPPGDVEPDACKQALCILDHEPATWEDCCDSTACWHDDDGWHVEACDPPPPDPCTACGADELCVQSYDGTCGQSTACVTKTVECPDNACSEECQAAYCGSGPLQCMTREPCGTESPSAFTCYGP